MSDRIIVVKKTAIQTVIKNLGITTFKALTDTPLLIEALKGIRGNAGATALEFYEIVDSDEKTKISANDTISGYLNGKLVAGDDIILTEEGDGGDETLSIATQGKSKVSLNDTTPGHLNGKLIIGKNILFTENSDGSNETLSIDGLETYNDIGNSGTGPIEIDFNDGSVQKLTVTGDFTLSFVNFPASGIAGNITLILVNGGSQTITFPAELNTAGGTAFSLTSSGTDVLEFVTHDAGTIIYGFLAGADLQ